MQSPKSPDPPTPRMVCIIFVAGHNDLLEKEIASDTSGKYEVLKGVPKALLPASDAQERARWRRRLRGRRRI